ncbi:hypothetical protein COV18_04135 [Candidatus Woesearchaeota archaeon CG10_big_fil_rev_8_21_14_0_10_37_12]|nr:MAG: hypothetical protein COV18_04135 [Candidatus Woesearchaeota archaeon CG10_big_fil_rev_8_21_14_0_10_37_12]
MFKELNDLSVFINEPDRELSIREYARLRRISPATALMRLHIFETQGLLVSKTLRNNKLYSANEQSQKYKLTKKYYSILSIINTELLQHLIDSFREPLAIYLFGSYAKAENRPNSDIDIFILTRTKTTIDISQFEKNINAKIQLFVYTEEELKKANKHLLNNIINGIKLYGFWEAF